MVKRKRYGVQVTFKNGQKSWFRRNTSKSDAKKYVSEPKKINSFVKYSRVKRDKWFE